MTGDGVEGYLDPESAYRGKICIFDSTARETIENVQKSEFERRHIRSTITQTNFEEHRYRII